MFHMFTHIFVLFTGCTLYGIAIGGGMGSITLTLVQCLVFSALIVAVDPVAVSEKNL